MTRAAPFFRVERRDPNSRKKDDKFPTRLCFLHLFSVCTGNFKVGFVMIVHVDLISPRFGSKDFFTYVGYFRFDCLRMKLCVR